MPQKIDERQLFIERLRQLESSYQLTELTNARALDIYSHLNAQTNSMFEKTMFAMNLLLHKHGNGLAGYDVDRMAEAVSDAVESVEMGAKKKSKDYLPKHSRLRISHERKAGHLTREDVAEGSLGMSRGDNHRGR